MDVFCLPSLWEGLPIGLLEAMAMRKAVIATAVDGSSEIIEPGKNGLLVPVQNVEALASAISQLAADAALRNSFGHAARATVARCFDINSMTRKIESIYLQTLNVN
jgi:glycosyltransferase involved in cell wall biosynthesis